MICRSQESARESFTLVEMLFSIAVISLMASAVLFALANVSESAKESRTRAQIAKLHELVLNKWEEYRTRRVPLNISFPSSGQAGNNPMYLAGARLLAIRDLMRMEFPERITDLMDNPIPIPVPGQAAAQMPIPSLLTTYRRAAKFNFNTNPPSPPATWTPQHQGAECLYLIVAAIREGDASGLEFFQKSELGDLDGDGMPEIIDGWGRPIEFLRWAPGFSLGAGPDKKWGSAQSNSISARGNGGDDDLVSELQLPDGASSPDPFDPLKVDDDLRASNPYPPPNSLPARMTFALVPLIYSSGRDEVYDIVTENENPPLIRYANTTSHSLRVDPFYLVVPSNANDAEKQVGTPWDITSPDGTGPDGVMGHLDNISNHLIDSR